MSIKRSKLRRRENLGVDLGGHTVAQANKGRITSSTERGVSNWELLQLHGGGVRMGSELEVQSNIANRRAGTLSSESMR